MEFRKALENKILVLDGAFGTEIQKLGFNDNDFRGREFMNHAQPLYGFNDILNLTKPSSIKSIHLSYLKSGADIITTNTFNSNAISMQDYGLDKIEGIVYRINKAGALIAKEALKEFLRDTQKSFLYIAGSIGPTNRSASLSAEITDPLKRNVSYDELFQAYCQQIEGLIEGGVDILLFETFFDTLNLKAGLDAANTIFRKNHIALPIMVSATVSDNAGRILSGQTLKAFVTSISHYDNVEVVGINCGFGPDRMEKYIKEIRDVNPHFTSCHPNAGLPNEDGCYTVSSHEFCQRIGPILKKGLLNVVGGCCGTSPEFIKVLSELTRNYTPNLPSTTTEELSLAGLDRLNVKDKFLTIGERCNVAGSAKFLRLIKEGSYEEAAEIAKNQILKGAEIIDINMDDAMLDAERDMVRFIRYILAEPEVAKVPFMIDSSSWNVIEAALKQIQGKGIVNSLSLKEGENVFIEKARRVKELGFALVVMAFDEKGQADTFHRKIEICERAYRLLTEECGFNPYDIIFDVNVMTIATGMKEHTLYAMDFIKSVEWIKKNLPGAKTSGGVSNLSFAFRGKNKIREYMHVIFLHHAKKAGLDMAIINPSQKTKYDEIPLEIRSTIEEIIFDKDPEAVERLIEIANEESTNNKKESNKTVCTDPESIEEILKNDLIKGTLLGLEEHILRALKEIKDPVRIIEGPLLAGMKKVGDLFGEGKMYLPQVVKTARSMKKAVEILTPYIENYKDKDSKKSGKILIATVKGDVHDIGKNIVATVLACNNYEIIDLGIMVPPEKIVEEALNEKPDIICLSGLITPSLSEMVSTVTKLSEAGITIPVMVGGAATSALHTALKIAPAYKGIVIHMNDASQNPIAANKLINPDTRNEYIRDINHQRDTLVAKSITPSKILKYETVLDIVKKEGRNEYICTKPGIEEGKTVKINIPIEEIIPLINWKMFFYAWKIQGNYIEDLPLLPFENIKENLIDKIKDEDRNKAFEAIELFKISQEILTNLKTSGNFDGKGLLKFEKAKGDLKNIYIKGHTFPMLRQQSEGSEFLSCCDFIGEHDNYIGLFAVTAGHYLNHLIEKFSREGDNYKSLIVQALSDRIAEASAEWLHRFVNEKIWPVTLRPAWGYPMLPDQKLILKANLIFPYHAIGISLTPNGAMFPSASVSGLLISNPKAKYFMVGEIGSDQIEDYAERCGVSSDEIKNRLRQI